MMGLGEDLGVMGEAVGLGEDTGLIQRHWEPLAISCGMKCDPAIELPIPSVAPLGVGEVEGKFWVATPSIRYAPPLPCIVVQSFSTYVVQFDKNFHDLLLH